MKKRMTLCHVALFCTCVFAENLIVNGGFEETSPMTIKRIPPKTVSNEINGWRVFNTDAEHVAVFEVVSDESLASEGSRLLKVTTQKATADRKDVGVDTARLAASSLIAIQAGMTYKLSFDLRHVSGENSILFSIKSFPDGKAPEQEAFDNDNGVLTPAEDKWSSYSYSFTPRMNGYFYVGFRPRKGQWPVDQVFLLDNVVLLKEKIN